MKRLAARKADSGFIVRIVLVGASRVPLLSLTGSVDPSCPGLSPPAGYAGAVLARGLTAAGVACVSGAVPLMLGRTAPRRERSATVQVTCSSYSVDTRVRW